MGRVVRRKGGEQDIEPARSHSAGSDCPRRVPRWKSALSRKGWEGSRDFPHSI